MTLYSSSPPNTNPSLIKPGRPCSILFLVFCAIALLALGLGIFCAWGFDKSSISVRGEINLMKLSDHPLIHPSVDQTNHKHHRLINPSLDQINQQQSPFYSPPPPNSLSSSSSSLSSSSLIISADKHDKLAVERKKPAHLANSDHQLAILKAPDCNIFEGKWVPDSEGPLYSNETCPILTQSQDCLGNGRPDRGYERWRWQPHRCELPRFDPRAFLEMMRGKTIGFVGDSVARNQMESLMCMLWQVEAPANKGNRRMQRWWFRRHGVRVVRIWSGWLVNATDEAFDYAPANLTKLNLELADQSYTHFLPTLDALVISSGHWWAKRTAYIRASKIVGGQLWKDKRLKGPPRPLKNPDAFALAMQTALKAIVSHAAYKGLTILRTYSPDHYEGGAWNTGGSCTGKTKPATHPVPNPYTDLMHAHQLVAFHQAAITTSKPLRLMDIKLAFDLRPDGHPGPYRNRDPHKITHRGPNGQPPPQDCLHWCMPGPVDTWNQFLQEILRQEFAKKPT